MYHKFFTGVMNSAVRKASSFVIVSHILLALTNTLAFHVTELITAIKSFMIQGPDCSTLPFTTFIGSIYCFLNDYAFHVCFLYQLQQSRRCIEQLR